MHAYWNEVVPYGIGDRRIAAVGESQRRAVGAEHGEEVDAFRGVIEGRKEPLGRV